MAANIIDGKAIAAKVREQVKVDAEAFATHAGRPPGLHVVLVGDDPASQVYVRNKETAAAKVGIAGAVHRLSAETSQAELEVLVGRLNGDDAIDGILIQLPLPRHLDAQRVLDLIDPAKDVDGLHPMNVGLLVAGREGLRPCTPSGCMRMLREIDYSVRGKNAIVIGRSNLVGKPLAMMLLEEHATVTIAHSRTTDLSRLVSAADLVVAAVGRAGLVSGEWIREGAVVLDVGINRGADGKLHCDVEQVSASQRAAWITPVPGGVGPMTIAMLLENTVRAASLRMRR